MSTDKKKPQSRSKRLRYYRSFGRTFWATIFTEIFERGAWYGFFTVAALFITSPNGLAATHEEKARILAVVPFILYLIPVISGTLAEKFGYKKMLLISLVTLSAGYFACSLVNPGEYYLFFVYFTLVALGAGMFKPIVTSTVTQATRGDNDKTSVGFGIFYMVVNLGGFVGPIIGAYFRPTVDDAGVLISGSWKTLFYLSSGYMAAMFFWVLVMYKEPTRMGGEKLSKKLREMVTDLKDPKLSILLIILMGFWATFTSWYNIMPSWGTEWVNSSSIAQYMPQKWVTGGNIKAEVIVNLNSLFIIFFSVWITNKVKTFNRIKVITTGTLLLCLATSLFGLSSPLSGGSLALMFLFVPICIFSVGELMSSPRSNELMAVIAPDGKVGTYQGYMFLSTAGGFFTSGMLSGFYGTFADKVGMYKKVLMTNHGIAESALEKMELEQLTTMLINHGVNIDALNHQLWTTHHPYAIWLITAVPGVLCVLALLVYRKFVPSLGKN